jgi:lysozyme
MTTPLLIEDLKRDEGCSLTAYPDPLSGGEPVTIGFGHVGPEVHDGLVWTSEQCETALQEDAAKACRLLDANIPWWRTQNDVRQDAMANMTFNMGWGSGTSGLSGFHNFLNFMRTGQYDQAATAMLDSRWADQVHQRATRLADMIRTGERPTP